MTITFTEPVLSADEERRLATAIEAGVLAWGALEEGERPHGATAEELEELWQRGLRAYDRFVNANMRLVAMVAYPVAKRARLDPDDLFQEGVLGLMEATRRYDQWRDCRFATFALTWVRMRVTESAVTRCGDVGLPPGRARAWAQVLAIAHAEGAGGRLASAESVAARTGRPVEQVRDLLSFVPARRMADEYGWPESPVEPAQAHVEHPSVYELLGRLGRDQREILQRLYGVGGVGASTYADLAAEWGVSQSTVRRRERAALDAVRRLSPLLDVA